MTTPTKRPPGRPVGYRKPAELHTDAKPRSVRLGAAHWAKLQRLGREWLERAIDRAKIT